MEANKETLMRAQRAVAACLRVRSRAGGEWPTAAGAPSKPSISRALLVFPPSSAHPSRTSPQTCSSVFLLTLRVWAWKVRLAPHPLRLPLPAPAPSPLPPCPLPQKTKLCHMLPHF